MRSSFATCPMDSANAFATSIGFFFWILASSKLTELARCPKAWLGGPSRVAAISRSGKACPEVCLRDEYPAFSTLSHSSLNDPKGLALSPCRFGESFLLSFDAESDLLRELWEAFSSHDERESIFPSKIDLTALRI